MKRRSRRAAGGQTIMMFALSFALFLLALVALVADAAALYVWSARVQAGAQVAAQAGANSVDPQYLYSQSGHLVDLSPSGGLMTFERGCTTVGDASAELTTASGTPLTADAPQPPGNGVRCVSDGCSVYAEIARTVQLPLPLFGDGIVVRGTYYAAPVVGTTTAAAGHCTAGPWLSEPPSALP